MDYIELDIRSFALPDICPFPITPIWGGRYLLPSVVILIRWRTQHISVIRVYLFLHPGLSIKTVTHRDK